MLEGALDDAALHVLGAFSEKDQGNHPDMWGMVLAFCRALPSAWKAIDSQKIVISKLTAFLRYAPSGQCPAVLLKSHLPAFKA